MNLLLVDDDMISVKGMISGINWEDCGIDGQVFIANDAVQADEIIKTEDVDIILCDIEMPGENGIELIRRIRVSNPEIVCVFLTCHAMFEYAQEAIRMGCHDYILTPAPYEIIAETVKKAVGELKLRMHEQRISAYGEQWLRKQEKQAESVQGDNRTATEIVDDTVAYIMENLSKSDLSLSGIAKRNYLNRDYLNRIFKREKKISLNQFIIGERMKLASALLQKENLSIASVATQTGYTNYSYFISSFKNHYGYTPSQYRDMLKK